MRVLAWLLVLFPLLELAVLIKVGSLIGVIPTVLLVIAGFFAGSWLLRLAGPVTAWRSRERLLRGEVPEQEMLEGLLLAIGGALLILPGFLSDLLALVCVAPPSRRWLIGRLLAQVKARTQAYQSGGHQVIEGEYQRRE